MDNSRLSKKLQGKTHRSTKSSAVFLTIEEVTYTCGTGHPARAERRDPKLSPCGDVEVLGGQEEGGAELQTAWHSTEGEP